ncbi:uncharacterized protein EAE97_011597 [Botrytis byssoidea]|uniref:Zn(2)-C6 fungal-type domain-containing protein n=1 Tax=Botrytis byssoidea TaxID=139641 RepID=A0A9P5LQA5_9HELO|nr:uncharacterized protein EAE97_011597 [Botrytis byssoidea]KAF7919679.1 hypothetical protein EAE97_011597 [Botrytis byssoidea]
MDPPSTSNECRPYRSHKIPACDRCRKRKLRCEADLSNGSCRICREQDVDCVRSEASKTRKQTSPNTNNIEVPSVRSLKRPRIIDSSPSASLRHENRFPEDSTAEQSGLQSPDYSRQERSNVNDKSSMIIGPIIAEDVQLLEQYMESQARPERSKRGRLYDTVSDNPKDPVIYLSVPRRREGLSSSERAGEKQKEILEQILGPNVREVVNLYFRHIHPSFPIIDEHNFNQLYSKGDKSLSPALMCDILASSLVYWRHCPNLKRFPVPDQRYCWNLAVESLQGCFLAPGLSTLYAALLDLTGRPIISITGNTLTSGRSVALAHSLGLNRDPSRWRISDHEKSLRTRLWWGVLIHDRWSSFAHGVPAHIRRNEYDVPLPTLKGLLTDGNHEILRIRPAECFILLCELTEILGDILPLLYDRRCRPITETNKLLRQLEINLDEWEESLPQWGTNKSNAEQVSGLSSLKLGFLSVKMLLCRIAFHSATHSPEPCIKENLNEFWMPYSAYHICSATIILLRCAIDTTDTETAESCKSSLSEVKQWLDWAHTSHHWDLAEICLAQCAEPIERLNVSSRSTATNVRENRTEQPGMEVVGESVGDPTNVPFLADTESLMNGLEYPFVDLWDMFEQEYE